MSPTLKEEFAELEEMVRTIEQAPAGVEPELLSSITREIERGRELASLADRVAVSIGQGALAVLAGLVVILRILGYGSDLPAIIVASLVGTSVLAGLIYTETYRDRVRRMSQKIRGDIAGTYKGMMPRYR